MANCGDFNAVVALKIEKHSIISATQPEASHRLLESLHVTGPALKIAIHAVKNLESLLAVDCTEIRAGFHRPYKSDTFRRCPLGHFFKPNSRRISSWGMLSPRASAARARSRAATASGVSSSSSTKACASERERGSTMTSSRVRTAFSFSSGNRSSSACACRRSCRGSRSKD
jgi:hypothetical protein